MKIHTTNYTNTFIEIADDCPSTTGEIPPLKGEQKTIANIQFEMISSNPYKYTSDDVLFLVFTEKNALTKSEYKKSTRGFFFQRTAMLQSVALNKTIWMGCSQRCGRKNSVGSLRNTGIQKILKEQITDGH